ncbi:hypothetical protein [Candidatus Phytoplasma sacchari]|uniref:ECF transporter S component n=1 Tax=Candidatus Phytoplasma sacchari TaxID=2609813 RepID=A0ABY7M2U3_9MOLU|nr:hypothetical protein O7R10_02050 [Candidatus Phytoplasma sacchari]
MIKKKYSFLKEIIITSFLSSISIIFRMLLFSIRKNFIYFYYFFYRIFLVDFFALLSIIPFLVLPFYSRIFFSFLGSFISEISWFFLRGSKFIFNPFLSFFYAICWGILPNIFLKNKKSFLKIYFSLTIIIFFHFVFYILLNILFINSLLFSNINKKILSLNFLNQKVFKNILLARFFLLFLNSFIISYLYIKIRNSILEYTSEYFRLN